MTTTTPTPTPTTFVEGDVVTTNTQLGLIAVGHYYSDTIPAGTEGILTKVNRNKVLFRAVIGRYERSYWVPIANLTPNDPNRPKPRKLGEVPPGMISPDDPKLLWFWDDAEKLARKNNYCSQYDSLTASLGVPGRVRKFSVTTKIAGIAVTTSVDARSQKLANEQVVAEFAKGGVAAVLA